MQPRVTAILVARNGAPYLERTLSALRYQSRSVDSVILVDDGSTDDSASMLADAAPTQLVSMDSAKPFGAAIAHALRVAAPEADNDDWLWLLAHDNAPEPRALAALLGAIEIAPSVAVAGPKLMRWDAPDTIAEYGETITKLGASVAIVSNELDQAQHDRRSDLLAVAASGMLVRRSVWTALGGFDPALPSVDAALDFCIRVRMAGHRIVGVPAAHVASDGGPESFMRRPTQALTSRLSRAAQLHRRLTYAPLLAVPLHWLTILPLAIVRSIWHLLRKRPGAITGEFSAAASAIVDRRVGPSRRNFSRNRVLRWTAIAPLRMPWTELREARAHQRELSTAPVLDGSARIRPSFLSAGGAWIVLLLAVTGAITFSTFIGAAALTGGGLAPLSDSLGNLWGNIGYGWRSVGAGFVGAADPFAAVLAVIGTLSFWAPSAGIVALYVVALPLAGLAAWWCAARFSTRGWAPAAAALLWALAPPFLSSLQTGHVGAVVTHIVLPVFVLALVGASRSWASSAAASLLFAVIAASSPSLLPVLLVGWLAWLVAHPTRIHRLMGIPVPGVILFVPIVIDQVSRGNWWGLLADPGVPAVSGTSSGWQLALGSPNAGTNGWESVASAFGLPGGAAVVIVAVLLAPLAILALFALFLPGSRRTIPSLAVALVGFVTAVAAAHISVTVVESASTTIWPGSGLSVFWLGLVGAAVVAIDAFRRTVAVTTVVASVAIFVLSLPMLVSFTAGTSDVAAGNGRILPAFVTAEASGDATLGTLVLTPQPGGGLTAVLERGEGTTLDEESTIASTSIDIDDAQQRIATLAGNISSRSGFDVAAELDALHIGFVLLDSSATDERLATIQRAQEALDSNASLVPVGETTSGNLWNAAAVSTDPVTPTLDAGEKTLSFISRLVLGIVFGVVLLLAIPTSRRRRSRLAVASDNPATTFDEEEID